ncbi:hypothetical protein BDV96DRAFT_653217 [Lophiotrema nucula]|uniref:DUF6604 domain-containing protein n=1 Tax=Lophiotrema nucula TaxID=690887 RepID=A0A6A5YL69_9PLEO|nr:hypothetical protein BDV96DRAFT_653217 [Lophiotrema nucula]
MGTYQIYKYYTDVYLAWLIKTANKLGLPPPVSTRLKGRDRTAANKSIKVPTKEIILRAEHIAKRAVDVIMPQNVKYSLDQAIELRKDFTSSYEKKHFKNLQADSSHKHFTSVLKNTFTTLMRSNRVRVEVLAGNQGHRVSSDQKSGLPNLFKYLHLEDMKEDTGSAAASPARTDPTPTSTAERLPYEADVNPHEELSFKWYCLTGDISDIRKYFQLHFPDVVNGALDLRVLTVLVEIAMDSVRSEQREIADLAKSLGNPSLLWGGDQDEAVNTTWESMVDIAGASKAAKGYLVEVQQLKYRKNHWPPQWLNKDNLFGQLMMDGKAELELRNKTWEVGKLSELKLKKPLHAATLDTMSRVLQEMLEAGTANLAGSLAGDLLVTFNQAAAANEGFLKNLRKMTQNLDMALAKAHEAKVVSPTSINDLVAKFFTIRSWITIWPLPRQRYTMLRSLPANHHLSGLHREYFDRLEESEEEKQRLTKYLTRSYKDLPGNSKTRKQYLNENINPPKDPDFLRKKNPILTGKLQLAVCLHQEEIGLAFANASGDLMAMAHIYNALKKVGILSGSWPLMDELIKLHIRDIFRGEPPSTAQPIFNQFQLAAGLSAQSLAAGKDPSRSHVKAKASQTGPRTLHSTPITEELRKYMNDQQTLPSTMHAIDRQLQHDVRQQRPQSYINQGVVPLLTILQQELPKILPRLDFEYILVTCICNAILKTMGAEVLKVTGGQKIATAPWYIKNALGMSIAKLVLGDLYNGSTGAGTADAPTEIVSSVAAVLQTYIRRGATGIP